MIWAKTPAFIAALLSIVILWQFIYNICAVTSMGERYTSFGWVMLEVISIIPGFILGCHVTWRLWKRNAATNWFFRVIAILYLVLAALVLGYFLYGISAKSHHQNERQHSSSYRKASDWWIYYFGVMLYWPAWLLSLTYFCLGRPLSEEDQ